MVDLVAASEVEVEFQGELRDDGCELEYDNVADAIALCRNGNIHYVEQGVHTPLRYRPGTALTATTFVRC